MSVNPALLQKLLRDNASDLQDYAKDLKSWGEEMKRKEESLENYKNKPGCSKDSRKRLKDERIDKPKIPFTKLGITDYEAWAKFDAEAELDKLEELDKDDSDLTDECNENSYDEAFLKKEKGNDFVKKQKWNEAIKCYTKAIELYSYDAVFYANRALCYLKINKFEEAEKDCNMSLKLDKTYVKAYQRRAAASINLKKFEFAENDLLTVLQLEPNNKESKIELAKVRQNLNRSAEMQRPVSKFTASRMKSSTPLYYPPVENNVPVTEKSFDIGKPTSPWPLDDSIIMVKSIKKPPHLRSQKPLKRIKITEVNNSSVESNMETNTDEAIKKHVFEKQQVVQEAEVIPTKGISEIKKQEIEKSGEMPVNKKQERLREESTKAINMCTKHESESIEKESPKIMSVFRKQKIDISENTNHSTALPKPNGQISYVNVDEFKIIENNPVTKDIKNTSNINIINDNKKSTENTDVKNSVQFYLNWKNLKSTHDKYVFLKAIDPQNFSKIFLNSLDTNIFSDILQVLAKESVENKENAFEILDKFTQVKRFSAIAMFMTAEDKRNLWKLLDYIKENEEINNEDVDSLIEKYEL